MGKLQLSLHPHFYEAANGIHLTGLLGSKGNTENPGTLVMCGRLTPTCQHRSQAAPTKRGPAPMGTGDMQ